MDLKTYLSILNRQRVVIISTLLFALLAAAAGTYMITPTYKAAATLRFATAISGSTEWVQYNIDYTDRLMNTYKQLATSSTANSELMRKFQPQNAPGISVDIIANSELMQIWVSNENASLTAQMANTLAEFLISEGAQITDSNRKRAQDLMQQQIASAEESLANNKATIDAMVGDSPSLNEQRAALGKTIGAQQVALDQLRKELEQAQLQETLQSATISVVDPAVTPSSPSSPNLMLNMLAGIAAGAIGGLGLAFLLENFDTRLRSKEQLQSLTKLQLLGEVPNSKKSNKDQMNEREIDPAAYDAFRRLSVSILSRATKQSFSSFLITSSDQQEGRSTIVANMAWALAESGRRVIVMDCDFHSPTIHMLFGLPNHIGLSNILQEQDWLWRQHSQPVSAGVPTSQVAVANRAPMTRVPANGASFEHEIEHNNGVSSSVSRLDDLSKDQDTPNISSILNKSLEVSVSNSVQRSMIPGVQVLSTGPQTLNNPAQLLSATRLSALMEQLQKRCDVVLIDGPAYTSAAYTSTLASVSDAVVFVVGYGIVKQDAVKETLSQLQTVNPNVLGVVANWSSSKRS